MTRIGVVLLVAFGAFAASARAGTYEVVACGDTASGTNSSWTSYSNNPSHLEIGNCSSASDGLFARDSISCTAACSLVPEGARAGWMFTAPSGTTVTALSYRRWLYKIDNEPWNPAAQTGDGDILETCSIAYPASGCALGAEGGARATFEVPAATVVRVGIECRDNAYDYCTKGATMHQVAAVLYGATVTLTDNITPTITSVAGGLFDGGYRSGRQGVSFDAGDNAGIRSARLYVDGIAKPATTYSCDFTYTVPCSDRSGGVLELDTSTVEDGTHQVEVVVTDPASNQTRSAARTVTVDNTAPTTPIGLAVDGGDAARSTNTFGVSWTNPAGQVAPIVAAHWSICDPSGLDCTSGETREAAIQSLAGLQVPAAGDWRLAVYLEDAAGHVQPSSAATATLSYAPVADGAASTASGATETPTAPASGSEPAIDAPILTTAPASVIPALTKLSPRLRISSYRLARGRLVVRGRTAAGVRGLATLRYRIGRRAFTVRRRLRGGRFVLRTPAARLPRSVSLRFLGSSSHLAQTARLRVPA